MHANVGDQSVRGEAPRRPTGLEEARRVLAGRFRPDPRIYWQDLLLSALSGWVGFYLAYRCGGNWLGVLGALASVLLLYRAVSFLHELTHIKDGALPGFRWAWNLLVGLPLLVPSFLYEGVHTEHHRRTVFGTRADPEYVPLADLPRWRTLAFLATPLLVPPLFAVRFLVLGPLTWIHPTLDRFVEGRASHLAVNPDWVRPPFDPALRRFRRIFELVAASAGAASIAAILTGAVSVRIVLVWYLVSCGIAAINQARTLVAHRWGSRWEATDVVGQLLDSVNVGRGFLAEVWAPVGLRFHALHHYLPDLPYHELGRGHRRLLAQLAPAAPYRELPDSTFFGALRSLWRRAGRSDPRTLEPTPCPSSTSTGS